MGECGAIYVWKSSLNNSLVYRGEFLVTFNVKAKAQMEIAPDPIALLLNIKTCTDQ